MVAVYNQERIINGYPLGTKEKLSGQCPLSEIRLK